MEGEEWESRVGLLNKKEQRDGWLATETSGLPLTVNFYPMALVHWLFVPPFFSFEVKPHEKYEKESVVRLCVSRSSVKSIK